MNHFVFRSDNEMQILKRNNPEDMLISTSEYWKFADDGVIGTVWGKLFNRSIIVDKHLQFDETMPVGEDKLFVLRYIQAMDSHEMIVVSNDALYYNRSDSVGSLTKRYIPNFVEISMAINREFRKMAAGIGGNSLEAQKRIEKDTTQLIDYALANATKDSAPKGIKRMLEIKRIIEVSGYKKTICDPVLFETSRAFRKILASENIILICLYLRLAKIKNNITRKD